MTRRGQRIVLRRRVHQSLNIVSYRREEAHVPDRTPDFADALPLFLLRDRVRGRLSEP
jgi:hypothetical protein